MKQFLRDGLKAECWTVMLIIAVTMLTWIGYAVYRMVRALYLATVPWMMDFLFRHEWREKALIGAIVLAGLAAVFVVGGLVGICQRAEDQLLAWTLFWGSSFGIVVVGSIVLSGY